MPTSWPLGSFNQAKLFLAQPVGIYSGQSMYQYRLTVVYVACGAEYEHVILSSVLLVSLG
jgi:hypothetical protein